MMRIACTAMLVALVLSPLAIGWGAEPEATSESVATETIPATARQSLTQARRQAQVLHDAMHATLQIVHHQYYREDEGLPIPAEILKGVFAELKGERHVTLRWLAVEGQAMNDDHKPQSLFEEDAVKALKAGKQAFERAEQGVYRRAASIALTNHCLKCHVPDRKSTQTRTAGLIIAIPLQEE